MLRHYAGLQQDYLGGPIATINLIGTSKGLERTLFERQNTVMLETGLLRNNEVDYFHYDFHGHCGENSDPMMDYLKSDVLPTHMERIGLFVMSNKIVDEVSYDGHHKKRKLVTEFERF